jgi:hypothetical protein
MEQSEARLGEALGALLAIGRYTASQSSRGLSDSNTCSSNLTSVTRAFEPPLQIYQKSRSYSKLWVTVL